MRRKIIKIDEVKCTGCGSCVPNCPEGALQIIDGKARLVGDLLCDGLGACIGNCPEGAILVEEREAEPYDEKKVMESIVKQGENVIIAHLDHLKHHGQEDLLKIAISFLKEQNINVKWPTQPKLGHACQCGESSNSSGSKNSSQQSMENVGCPGSRMREIKKEPTKISKKAEISDTPSELRNWPIQLKLAPTQAPYYKNADLLIASDCVGFTLTNMHRQFLNGKTLLIGCPKLDDSQFYIEKLAQIFHDNPIKSVHVLMMEVPCCSGLKYIVNQALLLANKQNAIPVSENTISIDGKILS